jgi:RNA polymerase sigma factor for flagellar operon FliA
MYAAEARDNAAAVAAHMELVRRIAFHLKGRLPASVQTEDLVQAGVIGLLEALQSYQDSKGASFSTYAGIRIRGAMLDEIRRQDGGPRSAHRDTRRISAAIRAVEGRTGAEASPRQIAAELGVDLDEYQRMLQRVTEARVLSLEDVLEGAPDDARLAGGAADGPDGICSRGEFASRLAAAISELPERERLVLSLYYDEELNLKEIGAVLGVSESRVCQLHGQALARLRSRLEAWFPD